MSIAAMRTRRATARLVATARSVARRVPPQVRGPIARRFKPQIRRATQMVDAPHWWQLARRLDAEGRDREAAAALMTAADTGQMLRAITQMMHTRSMRALMSETQNIDRMRAVATSDPESAEKQLLIGTFLLDQGHLDEGRALVRRGFELLAGSDRTRPLEVSDGRRGPDFLILGPHKTGTTSLYALLAEHPQVVPAPRKELHFWGQRHGRSMAHYEAYFPPRQPGMITGDGTPTYLHLSEALDGAVRCDTEIKAIVMRRDPVARAYSHHQMARRIGVERRGAEEAIAAELGLFGESAPLECGDVSIDESPYLLGSCILPYLQRWVGALGVDRVLVVESSSLLRDRQSTLDVVNDFLGLPGSSTEAVDNRNVHPYEPITESLERRLRTWFAPHEAALDQFLADHPTLVRSSG